EDIWAHTANRVPCALQSRGLPVGVVLSSGQDSHSIRTALLRIRQADRILSPEEKPETPGSLRCCVDHYSGVPRKNLLSSLY
uniref:Uncharacterized protein n=1 Tax=Mustela putorius furo TaxID=9669 RepID=M3XXY6_MUSPF